MEHPVQYLTVVTKFLDRLIAEQGDFLFVICTYVGLGVIVWILTRRRKRPVHDISVVILPLGLPPKREAEPEPVPFNDCDGF